MDRKYDHVPVRPGSDFNVLLVFDGGKFAGTCGTRSGFDPPRRQGVSLAGYEERAEGMGGNNNPERGSRAGDFDCLPSDAAAGSYETLIHTSKTVFRAPIPSDD